MTGLNGQKYDRTIVFYSGGMRSLSALLWAIEQGLPGIELWHYWEPGTAPAGWPAMAACCKVIAHQLGLPLQLFWLESGINQAIGRLWWETQETLESVGVNLRSSHWGKNLSTVLETQTHRQPNQITLVIFGTNKFVIDGTDCIAPVEAWSDTQLLEIMGWYELGNAHPDKKLPVA